MAMGVKEILEWARGEVDEISAAEMKAKLDQGEIDLVLDVREPGEYGGCGRLATAPGLGAGGALAARDSYGSGRGGLFG